MLKAYFSSPRVYLPFAIIGVVLIWMISKPLLSHKQAAEKVEKVEKAENDIILAKPLQKVLVQNAKNQLVYKELILQGEIVPNRRVDIQSETVAKVQNVYVKRGQVIQKGALLLSLEQDERSLKYQQAKSELESVTLDYNANETLVLKGAKSKTQFESMKAALSRAKTNLESARIELERTNIRAPFSGIIETTPPEIGQLLRMGDAILTLVDVDPLIVKAFVPQSEIGQLRLGAKGWATVLNGIKLTGSLRNIAPSAQNESRTFEIEFALDNAKNMPRIGLSTRLSITLDSSQAIEISPAILAQDKTGQLIVKIVNTKNNVEYLPITRVKTSASSLWVSGVPDDARVIIRGAGFVTDDEKVDAVALPDENTQTSIMAKKIFAAVFVWNIIKTDVMQPSVKKAIKEVAKQIAEQIAKKVIEQGAHK